MCLCINHSPFKNVLSSLYSRFSSSVSLLYLSLSTLHPSSFPLTYTVVQIRALWHVSILLLFIDIPGSNCWLTSVFLRWRAPWVQGYVTCISNSPALLRVGWYQVSSQSRFEEKNDWLMEYINESLEDNIYIYACVPIYIKFSGNILSVLFCHWKCFST